MSTSSSSSSTKATCNIRTLQLFLGFFLVCVFGGVYRYMDITTTPRWTRWINNEHHDLREVLVTLSANSSQQVPTHQVTSNSEQQVPIDEVRAFYLKPGNTSTEASLKVRPTSAVSDNQIESTTAAVDTEWEIEQEHRRDHLRKQCSSLGLGSRVDEYWLNINKGRLGHILVSDKHKTLYCYVPKVSCTNWKEVFLVMNGKATHEGVKKYSLSKIHMTTGAAKWRLNKYSNKEIMRRLETYTTFLVVRNPFTRTLSTYKDKFETSRQLSFRKNYGNKIHVKYGNHPNLAGKKPPARGYDVTFPEYVKYIGDRTISKFNGGPAEHWIPMVDLWFPCTVLYDIIGHLETLKNDTANILERIGGSQYMDLVVGQSPHGTNSSKRKTLGEFFDQLTEKDIEGIRWRYKKDFKLFGYSEDVPLH